MKFSAQSSYLYNCERRTVVCKVYRALSCLYPHAFLPQSVQQIVSAICHDCLRFICYFHPSTPWPAPPKWYNSPYSRNTCLC